MTSAVTKVEQLSQRVQTQYFEPGEKFSNILFDLDLIDVTPDGFIRKTPFVVSIGGEWVLQKDWPEYLGDNQTVVIERLAAGGGGGGSKIGAAIMAVVAVGAAFFTGGTSLLLLLPAAAMLLAGPVAVPKAMSPALTGKDSTSSTYSMGTNLNAARLYSSIPRLYGRVRIVPDLAAQPYVEFEGNEQFLYQLLVVSLGNAAVKQVYVGNTPLSNFDGVEVQLVKPYEKVTLFPDNVVTSSAVDNIQLNNTGSPAGPFVSSRVGVPVRRIAVDLHWPGGAYKVNPQNGSNISTSMGVQVIVTKVDDQGAPIGAPTALISKIFSFSTQTAQRVTLAADVPPGRYLVEVLRSGESKLSDNKIQNDVYWTGLKSYTEPVGNYGNVTLYAIKIRATDALNGSTSREFSMDAVGMIPEWNPVTGWTGEDVESQSIAWAAADILLNTYYGAGMGNTRIDLNGLYKLHQIWEYRKDKFNGYFDNTTPVWDAVLKVLRAGRAAAIYYAGRVEFIRDAPQTVPKLVLTPKRIIPGSLSVTYNWPTEKTPDHVVVQYMDEKTWTQQDVICALPGSPLLVPANIELFGATNRNQVWNEGITIAASNRYRRANVKLTVKMDGLIPRYNDLVSISHDLAAWGFSGVVMDINRQTGQIITSEPLPFDAPNNSIVFRKKNGSADGPWTIVPDASLPEGVYGGILIPTGTQQISSLFISDGIRFDRTAYQFGPSGRTSLLILCTRCTPRGSSSFDLEGVNYTDAVFIAETGQAIPPPVPPSSLVKPPSGPIIDRVVVTETTTPNKQVCSWTPAIGAQYYQVEHRLPAGTWSVIYSSIINTTVEVNLAGGQQSVRVRAIGNFAGPWTNWTGQILGGLLGLPEISSFVATPNFLNIYLAWDFTPDTRLIVAYVNIYASESPIPSPEATRLIGQFPFPVNTYVAPVGVPGRTVYFWIRAVDKAGREGPFFQAGTPIAGETTSDPEVLLQLLTNAVGASQLTQEMRETIASIIESGQDMKSAFESFQGVYETDKNTIAQNFTTLQSQLSDTEQAITQQISETKANIDGTLSATVTMRAQVNSNGKLVTAGIGLGVTPDPDDPTQYNSELIFMARRVAFIGDNPDGPLIAPLVIEGENVYMHGLFVKDATITRAKIGTLAVDTIKIGDEAVTIPRFMQRLETIPGGLLCGFSVDIPDFYNGTPTPMLIMTFTSLIGTVATGSYDYWVEVDGVEVVGIHLASSTATNRTLQYLAVLAPGTHTIALYGSIGTGVSQFHNPSILLLGAKR